LEFFGSIKIKFLGVIPQKNGVMRVPELIYSDLEHVVELQSMLTV
jgi:hypothetical protein